MNITIRKEEKYAELKIEIQNTTSFEFINKLEASDIKDHLIDVINELDDFIKND